MRNDFRITNVDADRTREFKTLEEFTEALNRYKKRGFHTVWYCFNKYNRFIVWTIAVSQYATPMIQEPSILDNSFMNQAIIYPRNSTIIQLYKGRQYSRSYTAVRYVVYCVTINNGIPNLSIVLDSSDKTAFEDLTSSYRDNYGKSEDGKTIYATIIREED